MIGMMYLVLTALLALNISKSILDAFVKLNVGIEKTTVVFDQSNGILYDAFGRAANESDAAKKWDKKAQEVKKLADGMVGHIDGLKSRLIELTDGLTKEVADTINVANVNAKDNYDVPSYLMGIADPSSPTEIAGDEEWSGMNLKKKLNDYQKGIVGVFEDKEVAKIISEKTNYLSTPDVQGEDGMDTWEVATFYHAPLAATITMLSKIQADVRTSEAEVISKLYEQIDAGGVSFNQVDGMAVLPKAYIMDGDTFRADIFTAASDDRVVPEVFVFTSETGGVDSAAWKKGVTDIDKLMKGTKGKAWGDGDWYQMEEKDVTEGKGRLKITESVGVHNWGGLIKLKTKKGPKVYPFSSSFEVGKPSLAVSADKMNVFYIGVDNPVSVSAPMPNFTASAPGLSKSGKGYMMRPRKKGKVNIVVTGIDETTGEKVNLGKVEFRVKRIPDPKSYFGGKSGSYSLKKTVLKNSSTVQAKMDNFDFDIRVKVSSFVFSSTKAGVVEEVKVNGNKLNSKCKQMIGRAKRNQKFFIEKVKVRMPDGSTRQLAPIIIKTI